MQFQPQKKQQRRRISPWLVSSMLLLTAALLFGLWQLTRPAVKPVDPTLSSSAGVLMTHTADQVSAITVQRKDEKPYTLKQTKVGWIDPEHPSAPLNTEIVGQMTETLAVIGYEAVLTEQRSVDAPNLSDFGLETPRLTVTARYGDGTQATLRFGNRIPGSEDNLRYLLVDDDPRLFAIDGGTMDALDFDRAALRPIPQPVLHGTRMDRIELKHGADLYAEWALNGGITDPSAAWELVFPVRYPAEEQAMSRLRKNIENIRLGAFVADATADTLSAYGFDDPRLMLTVHMAEGATYVPDADQGVVPHSWPESSFTLTIGGSLNDLIDYALMDGSIYRISHFQVQTFERLDPIASASRYLVTIPFADLASMTVTENGQTTRYVVRHDETGVFPYAGLPTDDGAALRYPYGLSDALLTAVTSSHRESSPALLCLKNGGMTDANAFKAAYIRLLNVSVSGTVEHGWQPGGTPTAAYRLVNSAGGRLSIDLYPYDRLHDAVVVNGVALFYLIHGGMLWSAFQ